MSDRSTQLATVSSLPAGQPKGNDLGRRLLRAAVRTAWAARGRKDNLSQDPSFQPPDRIYYRSEDGWEAPLWHYPAHPGSSGEPVVLAHGLATGSVGFDYMGDRSLARTLAAAGYLRQGAAAARPVGLPDRGPLL